MRHKLQHPNINLMRYGIREIVDVSQTLRDLIPNFNFIGENIGDPVAKGWNPPAFLKEILTEAVNGSDNGVFAYSHSRGRWETREWIVESSRKLAPADNLSPEDVVLTNGLGAAISCMYQMLAPGARVIQPAPAYPAHVSMERFSAGSESIKYNLDPFNGWQPDLVDLENRIRAHPEVTGILVINPNNPTGAVFGAEVLESIIKIAERYGLFIISDEVYFRMVFNGAEFTHITELAAGRVPLIIMKGLSKDVPWPGARSGWFEFHNTEMDPEFSAYAAGLKKRIMMEVCSTTLPQYILPKIYDHPGYSAWLTDMNRKLEQNSNFIVSILSKTPGLRISPVQGAFYLMPIFNDNVLNHRQTLPVENKSARAFIENAVSAPGFPPDKRFSYYLLASTGICVVPATDFESPFQGFRVTALDRDVDRLGNTYAAISEAIENYVSSGG